MIMLLIATSLSHLDLFISIPPQGIA